VLWTIVAMVAHQFGVRPEMVRVGSQVALIPIWFLAVYVMVVVVAPATHWLWRRWAMTSFWALVLGAVIVDAVGYTTELVELRWANYAFVWLAVHHLGYLWWDGRLAGPRALPWAIGGFAVLLFLVTVGGYPASMISVPGEEVSNSRPPTLALLGLGAFHGGLALAFEGSARRWLAGLRPWAATVLVNGTIMTLYLWHVSALVLAVGIAYLVGGIGLGLAPNSASWWATRPLWFVVLFAILWVFVSLFGRFEQRARGPSSSPPPAWQSVAGALALCLGLSLLALGGIGAPGSLGIRTWTVLLTLLGAALAAGARIPRALPRQGP
jgi:hypothetical protein